MKVILYAICALYFIIQNCHALQNGNTHQVFDNLFKNEFFIEPNDNDTATPIEFCVDYRRDSFEFWNVIEEDAASSGINKFHLSSNCSKFQAIKFDIFKIKAAYLKLIRQPIFSISYKQQKAIYEELIRQLQKYFHGQNLPEIQEKMSKFHSDITKALNEFASYLEDKEDKAHSIDENTIRQIAANIKENKIDDAFYLYNAHLFRNQQISQIVQVAYENKQNFHNIVTFMRRITDVEPLVLGYTALIDTLNSKKEMEFVDAVIIYNDVARQHNVFPFKGIVTKLSVTLQTTNENENLLSFYEYLKKSHHLLVKDLLQIFVKVIFDHDLDNTERVLDSLPNFDDNTYKVYVVDYLLKEMRGFGHVETSSKYADKIFMILYHITEFRKFSYTYAMDKMIDDIEKEVPLALREFLYGNLCIRTGLDYGYLHASSVPYYNQRDVYTSLEHERFNDSYAWRIEFIHGGRKIVIKNEKYGQYLHVMTEEDATRLLDSFNYDDYRAQYRLKMIDFGTTFVVTNEYSNNIIQVSDDVVDGVRTIHKMSRDHLAYSMRYEDLWMFETCKFNR